MQQPSFSGKTILVTGAAQGIGRAIAQHLLTLGAQVALADVQADALAQTISELSALGPCLGVGMDVQDEAQVVAGIDKVLQSWGQLDGLVNNAGISYFKPLADCSLQEWNQVIGINLTGTFLLSKYAAPHLQAQQGAIVNISSTRALMSEAGTEAYSASKGGVLALTHALAISLGPAVRVNAVSPGWIHLSEAPLSAADHAQHPAGRVGRGEDIASAVAFLLSEQAGFITGQNFVVDGGMTRKMIYEE